MTGMIVAAAGLAEVLIRLVGVGQGPMIGITIAAAGLLLQFRNTVAGSYVGSLLPGLLVMSMGKGLSVVPIT